MNENNLDRFNYLIENIGNTNAFIQGDLSNYYLSEYLKNSTHKIQQLSIGLTKSCICNELFVGYSDSSRRKCTTFQCFTIFEICLFISDSQRIRTNQRKKQQNELNFHYEHRAHAYCWLLSPRFGADILVLLIVFCWSLILLVFARLITCN